MTNIKDVCIVKNDNIELMSGELKFDFKENDDKIHNLLGAILYKTIVAKKDKRKDYKLNIVYVSSNTKKDIMDLFKLSNEAFKIFGVYIISRPDIMDGYAEYYHTWTTFEMGGKHND